MADKNQSQMGDGPVIFLLVCFALWGVSNNLGKIEAWAKEHWLMLAIIGAGILYVIRWILAWKFRMKHPEIYERELALKRMQQKSSRKSDEF